ncbi:MAG: hypothetical protein FWE42_09885 [Defluviitaleaceae bacterium]|nr:hypothetical protein [Defluviitaleaceae bacterium]
MKILHLRAPESRMPEGLFTEKLHQLGEYHDIPQTPDMPEGDIIDLIGQYDVLLTMWGSLPIPPKLAQKPGNLRYICNVSGSVKGWIPRELIEAGIQVTNWGDAPANGIAEGAMALLLATIKDIPKYVINTRAGIDGAAGPAIGTIYNSRVGIYGLGVIGQRFVELIRPFGPKLYVYDPYVDTLPDNCTRVNSLDDLCANADILVVHAGRSAETDYSITARHLAMLPDHGVIINTARGEIFVQEDLYAALETGRLRAGIDVFDADYFPASHPARQYPNLLYTSHTIGLEDWPPQNDGLGKRMYEIALENIERFKNGEPLKFTMDTVRYDRST